MNFSNISLKNLDLKNKRVLLRVDFNVPMDASRITDDSRIRAAIPTIEYILRSGGSIILMSHLGRPKGVDPKLTLAPCAKRLSKLLKKPVLMAPDCVGPVVEKMAKALKSGELLMLENLRFHEGEENPEKDPEFARSLASLGDAYVNDAFGTCHRAHASIVPVAKSFPGKAVMGFLVEEEIKHLTPLLQAPPRPFYAIIGGAKISTKLGVMHRLLDLVDVLYVGGAMAFSFFKAQGISMGDSPVEKFENLVSDKIRLPTDLVIADAFSESAQKKIIQVRDGIPTGWQGMDIGPETARAWAESLQQAATVFWNGPVGVFEKPSFAKGTKIVAEALARSQANVIVGGGDSLAAVQQMGLGSKFSYLSTGGGASLEFIEYGHLPGIDVLT